MCVLKTNYGVSEWIKDKCFVKIIVILLNLSIATKYKMRMYKFQLQNVAKCPN